MLSEQNEYRGGYAFYRLPDEHSFYYIAQRDAQPTTHSLPESDTMLSGFLVAPFSADNDTPCILIQPDCFVRLSIPENIDAPQWTLRHNERNERKDYAESFSRCMQMLTSGVCRKIVLSRRMEIQLNNLTDADAETLFYKACQLYPHSYIALWNTPTTGCWLTASPELLLRKSESTWYTMALAGTMPKNTPGVEKIENWSNKNREEQQIVADYIHGLLNEIAQNVSVSPTYPTAAIHVMHLRTDFSFTIPERISAKTLISRLHPTPAVCGIPCAIAHDAILQNEAHSRRYYSGFSGPFNLNSETALYVSLRCMELKSDRALLYAGGGLLADSKEEEEWEETERKMQTMLQLLHS